MFVGKTRHDYYVLSYNRYLNEPDEESSMMRYSHKVKTTHARIQKRRQIRGLIKDGRGVGEWTTYLGAALAAP